MIKTPDGVELTRVRTYDAGHRGNVAKTDMLSELLPHWQRGLVHVQMLQVRAMREGKRPGFIDTKSLPGYLSQRQWKSVVNQVNVNLKSWSAITVQRLRPLIYTIAKDDDKRQRDLLTVSKRGKWFVDPTLKPLVLAMARSDHPFPNLSRVHTMLMDGPIAQIEQSKTSTFRWWVRINGLPGTKPVRIPLLGSRYMDAQPGEVRRFCQISVAQDKTVTIRMVKASEAAELRTSGDVLGVDWGLTNLLTTSDGRRYGQALYEWLIDRDRELTQLAASLQRQGIKLNASKRYRRLNTRIREYVANEVGRILNLITDGDVRTLVVEGLDFRGKSLSKRVSRLVSRAGRAVLNRRLKCLPDDRGVTVVKTSAAYSSRTCSGCGYTDQKNRTSQAVFHCRFCGKAVHADVNAARNVRERRSSPVALPYTSKEQVLAYLDQCFETRWGISADRIRERQRRPRSRASSTLTEVGRCGGQPVA